MSTIEWTDETWPVITGCTPVSSGCKNCYAARLAATRLKHHPRYKGLAALKNGKGVWSGEIRLNSDILDQPLHWRKPRMVFPCSMSDLFHEDVPFGFVRAVFEIMSRTPQHTYQILTKRSHRMLEFVEWLQGSYGSWLIGANVWGLVTAENQEQADKRIPILLQCPFVVRGVSVEPMLGPIDLSPWLPQLCPVHLVVHPQGRQCVGEEWPSVLDWVICGGESGPGARPMHPQWPRDLREQCQIADVPYFHKQNGEWLDAFTYIQRGLSFPGRTFPHHRWPDNSTSFRVGRKTAGRLLDGREWNEYPRKRDYVKGDEYGGASNHIQQ